MAGEDEATGEARKVSPPAPGLFWLAIESPWAGPGRPHPRCIIGDDGTLAKRLRAAWKGLKESVGEHETGKLYLEQAELAGKERRWIDCAGWMEAARRTSLTSSLEKTL